ncbi:hypothetical protein G6F59_017010 [Rhizopus arrhizus]|nr:hypothetical protein G6F59_017010 [Rhizopus arrhizus]
MQALAVLVDPVLHPCHFIGHLPIGVGALPHVADEDVLAAITAEHVDLGQLHRHQADQHDQHDAEQAPATMVQRPVQQRGIAALQPGDHAGLRVHQLGRGHARGQHRDQADRDQPRSQQRDRDGSARTRCSGTTCPR